MLTRCHFNYFELRNPHFVIPTAGGISGSLSRTTAILLSKPEIPRRLRRLARNDNNNSMIPESEIHINFVRSSGPGGQNVNKVSTKAQLRWSVGESAVFNFWEKDRIREKLKTRLNKEDEVVVSCDDERSQAQNKAKAIHILQTIVKNALKIPKRRVATRPTRASKERRLEAKAKRSHVKKQRTNMIEL